MEKRFYDAIADNPIIAAVKNMDGLEAGKVKRIFRSKKSRRKRRNKVWQSM